MSLQSAADVVVKELIGKEDRSRGAVIAISRGGEVAFASTGYGLLHGYATDKIPPAVAVKVE